LEKAKNRINLNIKETLVEMMMDISGYLIIHKRLAKYTLSGSILGSRIPPIKSMAWTFKELAEVQRKAY
jgi:hypothetical protein